MSKWIDVKTRLPKDTNLKIIKYAREGKHIGIQLSRYLTPSNMNKNVWVFEFRTTTQNLKVTHWANMPTD